MDPDPFGMTDILWRNSDDGRNFIVPARLPLPDGSYRATRFDGTEVQTSEQWLCPYEVTEAEARDWAMREFGAALSDMRQRIDRKLGRTRAALDAARRAPVAPDSDLTNDAVPALFALAKALPGAIMGALSGNPHRIQSAQDSLSEVQNRLNAAGIAVDDRLASFPDRLAELRNDFERRR